MSQNGKRLLVVDWSGFRTWEPATDVNAIDHDVSPPGVISAAWSPDGKKFVWGTQRGTAQIWDATTGKHILDYQGKLQGQQYSLAWSPDGKRIVSGAQDGVEIWDAATGKSVFSYPGQTTGEILVAWSPDGKHIASGLDTVQMWEASTGNLAFEYANNASVLAIVWSPDGKYIATEIRDGAGKDTVHVLDASTGALKVTYPGYAGSSVNGLPRSDGNSILSWSRNGKYIAAIGDKNTTVQVYDALTGKQRLTYDQSSEILTLAWAPDSQKIASGGVDGVKVWQAV